MTKSKLVLRLSKKYSHLYQRHIETTGNKRKKDFLLCVRSIRARQVWDSKNLTHLLAH